MRPQRIELGPSGLRRARAVRLGGGRYQGRTLGALADEIDTEQAHMYIAMLARRLPRDRPEGDAAAVVLEHANPRKLL